MKVFDITPPSADKNGIGDDPPSLLRELRRTSKGNKGVEVRGINKTVETKVAKGVLAMLALAGCFGFYYFFGEQKVVIEIAWETEPVSHSALANVSGNGDILGVMLAQENSGSKEFSCTGIVEKKEKAQGTITIYNNYSSASQPLIATTRFISDSGQLFRIPKRVVVPGMGSVETTIIADQPCEEYNIKPSTFSIPGFAGTNKYTAFYAKSFSDFTGGACKEVAVVGEQDFTDAENFLKNETFSKGMEFLGQKREQGFIILDCAIEQEVIEFSPLAKLEQEVDSFIAQIKSRTKAFAFSEQDLRDFAKKYIGAEISQDRKIHEQSLDVDWKFKNINLSGDDIELEMEMNCDVYVDLDKQELKRKIAGKDFDDVARVLAGNAEIRRAVVKSKPFYMRKVPMGLDSIEIVDKF